MLKRSYTLVLVAILLAVLAYAAEEERVTIKPVKGLEDATLLDAGWWRLGGLDSLTRSRMQVYYLYGFLDAHTLWQLKSTRSQIKEFSKSCEGMDVSELLEMMNEMYRSNPDLREVEPAFMLTLWVPAIKEAIERESPDTAGTKSGK
jgi:hypothetical protein